MTRYRHGNHFNSCMEFQMNQSKRSTLKTGGTAGLVAALMAIGLVRPGPAQAALAEDAFKAKGVAGGLKALGATDATESDKITLNAPEIAENGAVVPVNVKTALPKVTMIAVLVDKNPTALTGAYELMEGVTPDITMRVKMGESSDIIALVKSDGKFYMTRKDVKVTLGGCGG